GDGKFHWRDGIHLTSDDVFVEGIQVAYLHENIRTPKGSDKCGHTKAEYRRPVGLQSHQRKLEQVVEKMNDTRQRNRQVDRKKDREDRHEDGTQTKAREEDRKSVV